MPDIRIPSAAPAGITPPSAHGYQGWAYDPAFVASAAVAITAGQLNVSRIEVPKPIIATSVDAYVSTAGVTLANTFVGVYDSAGNLIGTSADASVNYQSTLLRTNTLVGGPFPISGGPGVWVWAAFVFGSGTTLQLQRSTTAGSALVNANLPVSAARGAVILSGLTALPGSFTPASLAINQQLWMAIR